MLWNETLEIRQMTVIEVGIRSEPTTKEGISFLSKAIEEESNPMPIAFLHSHSMTLFTITHSLAHFTF